MGGIRERLIDLLFIIPAILGALTIHEFSHALVSSMLGDPLPKEKGRLSLNPFDHLDPAGILMLILVGFGWAKPVHVDPRYYKNPRLGMSLVAVAGPVSNLILAFILCFFLALLSLVPISSNLVMIIYQLLFYGISINIGLAIFNLIPVPPLDGSKVLFSFLPPKAYNKFLQVERYGIIILICLLLGIPSRLLSLIGLPGTVTMWFDLTTYLSIARSAIMNAYFFFISMIINLFT
jgi:Zn-dependent protease